MYVKLRRDIGGQLVKNCNISILFAYGMFNSISIYLKTPKTRKKNNYLVKSLLLDVLILLLFGFFNEKNHSF